MALVQVLLYQSDSNWHLDIRSEPVALHPVLGHSALLMKNMALQISWSSHSGSKKSRHGSERGEMHIGGCGCGVDKPVSDLP